MYNASIKEPMIYCIMWRKRKSHPRTARVSSVSRFLGPQFGDKGLDVEVDGHHYGDDVTEDDQHILDPHLCPVGLVRYALSILAPQRTLSIEI